MNKIYILIIILFIGSSSMAQSVYDLDSRNGFKHYKFGTSIKSYPNLSRTKTLLERLNNSLDANLATYIDSKKDNSVGDIAVNDIQYAFVNGSLYTVSFETSLLKARTLYKTYVELYGKPTSRSTSPINEKRFIYTWKGKNVHLEVTLDESPQTYISGGNNKESGGHVLYTYVPLDKKLKELKAQSERSSDNKLRRDL
ncbi:hypothetical protein I0P70_09750 [Pontibacter sp. FD36]|uniref:hypothetical protein n=1 Tax=Pontibacter sp. FD36 TaxID=2789860 RepID=UPI0018A97F3D|nr:hypothetical protein [Pontibacter sp. FD36]MBF8963531.1 hypothetical protein [Pontibacter sp. FD36]